MDEFNKLGELKRDCRFRMVLGHFGQPTKSWAIFFCLGVRGLDRTIGFALNKSDAESELLKAKGQYDGYLLGAGAKPAWL